MELDKDLIEKLEELDILIDFKYDSDNDTFKLINAKETIEELIKKYIDLKEKMEIEEMTAMFNINNVHATTEDIKQLLFKNKKTQKLFFVFNKVHNIADRLDVLNALVRHFDLKLILDRHDKINDVHAVRTEILGYVGLHSDIVLRDVKLFT